MPAAKFQLILIHFSLISPVLKCLAPFLKQVVRLKPTPVSSWLRIFKLPGAEKLMLTPSNDASRPQSGLLDVHAFGNIVMNLSECDTNYQVPSYRFDSLDIFHILL